MSVDLVGSRRCSGCGQFKLFAEFSFRDKSLGLLRGRCKSCVNAEVRQRRAALPEDVRRAMDRALRAGYKERHPERLQAITRAKNSRRDKESMRYAARIYREKNKELCLDRERAKGRRQREQLEDLYIVKTLGFTSAKDVPAELIQAKREQLAILRMAKLLKEAIHESSKNPG